MTVAEAVAAKNIYENSGNLKEARKMKVRIQEKFTLPCACIVFGLIGSSLGSKSNLNYISVNLLFRRAFNLKIVLFSVLKAYVATHNSPSTKRVCKLN